MRTLVLLFLSIGCTIASANAKETLTIYTYDSFASEWGPGPNIKKAFEKECGCLLQFVPLEDGVAILNRLKLEGKYSRADLVLGMDDAMLAEARKSGLFAEHKVDLAPITMPGGWQDPTFLPYDYGYLAFVYDTQKLKQAPTSFAELASRQDLRIIYEDPRTSTPGQGLLIWIKQTHKEEAAKLWQQLAKRTVTVTKGWSEAYYTEFSKNGGTRPLVVSYATSPAAEVFYSKTKISESPTGVLFLKGGVFRQVEGVALIKGGGQREAAGRFIEFMRSPAVQEALQTSMWMFPSEPGVARAEVMRHAAEPAVFDSLGSEAIAEKGADWVSRWTKVVLK